MLAARNLKRRFVVPFVGRFAAVQAMVSVGVKPDQVIASDISLLSSTLGYLCAERPLEDLNVRFLDKRLEPLASILEDGKPVEQAAAILYAIKFSQLRGAKNYYIQSALDELLINRQRYLKNLQDRAIEHLAKLKGLTYRIRDAREEVAEFRDDPTVMLVINPPAYRQGYVKMFPFEEVLEWNEPKVAQFDGSGPDFGGMMADLVDAEATAVCLTIDFPTMRNQDLVPPGWMTVFSQVYDNQKNILYWVTNKVMEPLPVARKIPNLVAHRRKIFNDSIEIKPNTRVGIIWVEHAEAAYYRDLFVHRLGSVSSELNGLMLLDDHVFSVFGISINQVTRRRENYVHETYGMSVHSDRYPRINRLFMRLLTTRDFLRAMSAAINFGPRKPEKVRTACIARLPEVRLNAGILKLVSRERQKDGTYFLVYEAPFDPRTSFKAAITMYLDELAKAERRKNAEKEEDETPTPASPGQRA